MGFNWDGMNRTPEAILRKAEGKLTIHQLAEKSRSMAENIIRPGRFIDDVRRHMDDIVHGTDEQKEIISREIVLRNPGVIPDHVEDEKEIAGLVLEIALLLQEEDAIQRRQFN